MSSSLPSQKHEKKRKQALKLTSSSHLSQIQEKRAKGSPILVWERHWPPKEHMKVFGNNCSKPPQKSNIFGIARLTLHIRHRYSDEKAS
jgi:uncharacterized protein YvpB